MSLKEFSCDFLELECEFTLDIFDMAAFLADIQVEDKPGYTWSYGSTKNPGKEHAHLGIRFRNGKGELRIAFHVLDLEVNDKRPPYMEDCVQWIGGFFKSDELMADIRAVFIFDKSHAPALALPFPLITESKELSGSMVSGVIIELPRRMHIRRAAIQKNDNNTLIVINTRRRIKLKSFDLEVELSKLSKPTTMLVKKTGEEQ